MATDLFDKPVGGYPAFTLNLQQKRQATLLYHWMSLDYLRGLKSLTDALIKGADVNLELAKQQGRDALLTNDRWGVRDTSANWSTFVFPALEDFRKSTIRLIAWRTSESYCGTGATQCSRMIDEHSSQWMTEDEEKRFREQFDKVHHHAQFIDYAAGVGGDRTHLTDFTMNLHWREFGALFDRLPRFRVRTDVEGVTGRRPVRTGVYVSQDDPHATMQFAWIGNNDGILGDAQTFNDVGRRMVATVGRTSLWNDDKRMADFALEVISRKEVSDIGPYSLEKVQRDPSNASYAMAFAAFTTRPCKWCFVEKIEGEFDDEAATGSSTAASPATARLRCEAGQPCSREGFWFTPARPNSRRAFQQGEAMPDVGGAYGATIWQWDEQQGT